ncbi:MAG: flagellin lysine-N-methylase [Clostridia bacterium]|nr:flagellin lysine-N-methylase [Clostridia bacterium]
MKLIVPDYYNDFCCIADRCKHSCCIGWEIDIDNETLERYRNIGGDFGVRLQDGIETDICGAHFRLGAQERCPFLNREGLCDIILTLGEAYLSQICTDHPRFCSFYSDRTEIGLGLCCEEATRIILFKETETKFSVLDDDGEEEIPTEEEKAFFAQRERLFTLAQDRRKTISERMNDLQREIGLVFPNRSFAEWVDIFLSLECMDDAWKTLLLESRKKSVYDVSSDIPEIIWGQLLVYFLYRHVSDPERDIGGSVLFAILGVYMIRNLFSYLCCREKANKKEELIEICRLYSSEIEYSEENTEQLILFLEKSSQKNERKDDFRYERND